MYVYMYLFIRQIVRGYTSVFLITCSTKQKQCSVLQNCCLLYCFMLSAFSYMIVYQPNDTLEFYINLQPRLRAALYYVDPAPHPVTTRTNLPARLKQRQFCCQNGMILNTFRLWEFMGILEPKARLPSGRPIRPWVHTL